MLAFAFFVSGFVHAATVSAVATASTVLAAATASTAPAVVTAHVAVAALAAAKDQKFHLAIRKRYAPAVLQGLFLFEFQA